MFSCIDFIAQFLIKAASPLDALTVFLNRLLGSNQTPDGYLIYLLVMGGLFIIALVLIYNWWEERKFNAQVEKSFSPIQNDALLDQNKKQFLDKFAATTGYLSDTPDANSFGGQKPAEVADEKSIDDVYSELLDTMTKRGQKPAQNAQGRHDDQVTHDNAEHFNLPNMEVEPKNAPLPENIVNAVLSASQPEIADSDAKNDPESDNAIRSIIDQVFRNKNQIKPAATQEGAPIKAEMLQKNGLKDESALNAYLSLKESVSLDMAHVQSDKPATTKVNEVAEDVSATQVANAADHVLSSMVGLSVVKNAEVQNSDQQTKTPDTAPAQLHETPADQHEHDAIGLPALLNLQVDVVGVLALNAGMSFDLLVDSFSALYKDFDKPVFVHLQDANKKWMPINNTIKLSSTELASHTPQKVACSMQLADRSGAASRNVINRFQMAFENIATNLGGRVQWQNDGDIFSQAMSLDAFCIEVDKTMFFHLMHEATGPFTGIKLKGIAESQSMALANDGSFKFFGEVDKNYPEFVMFNRDNHPFSAEMLRASVVKAVTFQLDIPHTLPQAVALDRMVSVARNMEVGLNAVLVDDNNRPLADMQIERIRDQIKSIHAMMQLRGIMPGSDIAHRLFS